MQGSPGKRVIGILFNPFPVRTTLRRMRDENEEIAELLSDDRLQSKELASRLYYMYGHNVRTPVSTEIDESRPVPQEVLEKLREYRKYAILPYDYRSEDDLSIPLRKFGGLGRSVGAVQDECSS